MTIEFDRVRVRCLLLVIFLMSTVTATADDKKPLKVFILAGQSNMVGHARAHTVATLLASDDKRDQDLLKMILEPGHGFNQQTLEKQLARGQQIDALTGGISNDKIKQMKEGADKEALVEKVNALKAEHELYKKTIASKCTESDQVYIHSIADRNEQSGPLRIGCGAATDKIGPEYGFGLSIASQIDGPALIIKTSWGGKSLHYNFRPPSAGAYVLNDKEKASDKVDDIKKNAGLNYRMMMESVSKVLENLSDHHPDYREDSGYEISGFVWFQGFNDQFADEFRNAYKSNMVTFIQDVRKDLKKPDLPFVIGVLGTAVTPEKIAENPVSVAQRAAAEELGLENSVVSVESYPHYSHYSNAVFQKGWPEHYHQWDTVGSDRPYHYLGSGAFFVRLGDAFADAMAGLMAN